MNIHLPGQGKRYKDLQYKENHFHTQVHILTSVNEYLDDFTPTSIFHNRRNKLSKELQIK